MRAFAVSVLAVFAGLALVASTRANGGSLARRVMELVPGRGAEVKCPAVVDTFGADPRLRGAGILVVEKGARRVGLYGAGRRVGCWRVGLGVGAPAGPKRKQGDLRTPEGWYRISDKPWSQFAGAIAVHYPNAADADRGLADGLIDRGTHRAITAAVTRGEKPPQGTVLGGEILLHGGGSRFDWTLGCVALEDADLADLRSRLGAAGLSTDLLVLP